MSLDHQVRSSLFSSYRPALVKLSDNLIAACFPLMKMYPAYLCLERAISCKLVGPDSLIVESSSGTMALGLAIACRWRGYKLAIVSDNACDARLVSRLAELGATVDLVHSPAAVGGYQRARLDRVEEICRTNKDSWWVNQYDNFANSEAYATFAAQLVECIGGVDCLVGTVGSGGSVCGTAKCLRTLFPELTVVGVDTFGSVLFGQPDAPRALRGLGNSILPKNLDHTVFDEVHWVTAAEAFTATRILHRETGLLRGPTSGACWLVARYWAKRHTPSRTICLFPDEGWRYIDSVYSDTYMHQHELLLKSLPDHPREVHSAVDAGRAWSSMRWNRRTYDSIVSSLTLGPAHATAISAFS